MRKYPSQETAEFIVEIFNFFNTVSTSGVDKEVVRDFEEMDVMRQKMFVKNFGDHSPWKCTMTKKRTLKVVWDAEKARKLGL
ncbi:MAG: hypothetical protein BWY74_01842 [Firmicutes bacterium ADurb.Bin419]|nr:MAG: hypothetical protein BWY74_01842 [Firmicutes bacterium ADurb.Bin419]